MYKLFCILSTGRSGTSLLSNIASSINFNLSDYLVGKHPSNVKGHFEDLIIMDRNEYFLQQIGKTIWSTDKLSDIENQYFTSNFKPEIVKYLTDNLAVKKNFLIKEPRISKLFHLYKNIFSELNSKNYYMLLYRSPYLYVKSTNKAYSDLDIDLRKGSKVWFLHNYNILSNISENDNLYYLNFSDFIKDIPYYAKEISNFVEEFVIEDEFNNYYNQFYEKKMVSFSEDQPSGITYADEFFDFIQNIKKYNFQEFKNNLRKWNLEKILKEE